MGERAVLVLDADMVPALTIARSLHARDCRISVASHLPKPIASYSRCVSDSFACPDPLSDQAAFLDWLIRHCGERRYDLVIPVTERTLVPISNGRDRLERIRIAMPSRESLELALDKEQTMALATRVGVPVPGSELVSEPGELDGLLAGITYPVVLKPARSLSSNSKGASQLKVSYAFTESELRADVEHALKFGPLLLQEYFHGAGVGIELIAQQGRIVYAFQHLRLHEVPITGGGSTLRKSMPVDSKLLAAAEALVDGLRWNGVAMVEFKWRADTGEFTLMEINGRFWGSLPLADAAGADFPSMLLDLELDGKVGPHSAFRPDVYCRKLSSDLYWYEAVLRSGPESRVADIPGVWEIVKELKLLFLPRHYFDVQSFRDPLPGFIDLRDIAVSYIQRVASVLGERYYFWRQQRGWRQGEVDRRVAEARKLLFVCYGNINRSALADAIAGDYATDCGVSVVSAGLHPEEGRMADPVMAEVAAAHGIDLSPSRSVLVTPDLLRESDVIFVMEKRHADALLEMEPEAADKIVLLGAHVRSRGRRPEIEDPYGRPREIYERCFSQISQAVDQVKNALVSRATDS